MNGIIFAENLAPHYDEIPTPEDVRRRESFDAIVDLATAQGLSEPALRHREQQKGLTAIEDDDTTEVVFRKKNYRFRRQVA